MLVPASGCIDGEWIVFGSRLFIEEGGVSQPG